MTLSACGGGSDPGGGGGGGGNPPLAPTGLTATPGDQQVSLTWNASSGATSYHVKRSSTAGGPYIQIAAPGGASYTDTGLSNGTAYYYVVSALNTHGESSNSGEAFATPFAPPPVSVHVTVDVLDNRHLISPVIYGGNYPKDSNAVTQSGTTLVRWGGNATSRYNWKTHTYNAANDWYYSDYVHTELGASDSAQFVQNVKAAGSSPLITLVMLDWVSKGDPAQGTDNGQLYSFSVAKYGAQCADRRPDNSDAGKGLLPDCSTPVTGNDPNDANVPLRDAPQAGDPPGTIYRNQWAAALAAAFGSAPHFYDLDNEMDIWGSTHRDVHPAPSAYNELRDTYLRVARNLKTWDPQAIRMGPVSCCWWFYWNGADNNDKAAHGGVDFVPWWLNEVYWRDLVDGTRSLDVFDIHAYPNGPDTSGWTTAQKRALELRIYRDYWDPAYVSESGEINQPWATQIQPNKTIPFRIPRMRALINTIYPGTPMSLTEWSAAFAGDSDFSTALADVEAYGILGRERVYAATRWVAPDPANPNFQALKLYRNYDGAHNGFGTMSVSASHDADVNLFSSYAALNSSSSALTVMVVNKDPQVTQQAQIVLNGFSPAQVTTYTLAATSPNTIVSSGPMAWPGTFALAPYSATLLVVTGSMAQAPAAEWDLNPDVIMVPAGGTVTLSPEITSGSSHVTLTGSQSDVGITVTRTQPNLTPTQNGTITVTAGSTPGFYHFTVTGIDGAGVNQEQNGWILVGNPPAGLSKTGDNQTGPPGSTLTLTATLNPGSSGGNNPGASIFFTTDAGSLSSRIVATDASGRATVTLTLPNNPATVHVTAEGPIALGHPVVTFTETAQ